jgi:hypothetical protein
VGVVEPCLAAQPALLTVMGHGAFPLVGCRDAVRDGEPSTAPASGEAEAVRSAHTTRVAAGPQPIFAVIQAKRYQKTFGVKAVRGCAAKRGAGDR